MEDGQTRRRSLYGFETREPDLRRKEDRKTYDIKAMWQLSHEIVNLSAQGVKQVDIARVLGVSTQTVSNTLNSELAMKKLSKLRGARDEKAEEVSKEIEDLTDEAIKIYHEIFKNEGGIAPIGLRKKTADTVMLELSGLRVPTKVQSASLHASATLEEIEEFKERGIKAARESGMVIDVESEKSAE